MNRLGACENGFTSLTRALVPSFVAQTSGLEMFNLARA